MCAINEVIWGDHKGKHISIKLEKVYIIDPSSNILLDKSTVESCDIIDVFQPESKLTIFASISADSVFRYRDTATDLLYDKENASHTIAILFFDGTKSVIRVNKQIYTTLISSLS